MSLHSPISIEALMVLDAIEHRGSFAAAAEQLNKVPSALSYIVQKLEEQLGVSLYVKQGRRSVLTPAGRHLLLEGRKLLSAVEQITHQTQTIAKGWEPKINIAVDTILDIEDIYRKVSDFLNEYPDIELNIFEEVMKGSWEALIDDKVDIVIGAAEPAPVNKGLSVRPYCVTDNVLMASPEHPLAQNKIVASSQQLTKHRTIIVRDSVRADVARSANIIEQSQHFYVQSLEQKIKAIVANIGIGFLPRQRVKTLVDSGLLVELNTDIEVTNSSLYVAWKTANRGKGLTALRTMLLTD